MDTLAARIGTLELYLDATLLVALAGIVWTVASRVTQEIYFKLALRTRKFEFLLTADEGVPENIESLNLLFIRYGNDTYLTNLASDQEKYHGRLRNKVIKVLDRPPESAQPIRVNINVHRRLGTQFKFFIEVRGDPQAAIDYLTKHDTISDISSRERPAIRLGEVPRHRIFFLVDRLDVVETVDGFKNNFIFPV